MCKFLLTYSTTKNTHATTFKKSSREGDFEWIWENIFLHNKHLLTTYVEVNSCFTVTTLYGVQKTIGTDWKLIDEAPTELLRDKPWNAASEHNLWQLGWVAECVRQPELITHKHICSLQTVASQHSRAFIPPQHQGATFSQTRIETSLLFLSFSSLPPFHSLPFRSTPPSHLLPLPFLSFSVVLFLALIPPPPLRSRTPWLQLKGLGERCKLPSGYEAKPQPKLNWVHFIPKQF